MVRRSMLLVSALLSAGFLCFGQAPPAPSKQDQAVAKDFEARVKNYMSVRKKEAGKSPHPTNSTVEITETHEQMAMSIRSARANAHQGDIFTPVIADYFRHQIAATLSGPEGSRIKASLRHAEPVRGIDLKVNDKYPQSVPLQSTPAGLLLNLPTLPKELQYRIVGNALVLYDSGPNLIVDVIPNVLPQ